MGLKQTYRTDEQFRRFCNSIIALAFVPEHDVVRAINMLKKKDREMTKVTFKINTDSFGKEYIELTHNEFTKQ